MAAELVRRGVAVIVATGGAHHVAKAATTTIPIVCTIGADPVRDGLVASINRPGGNVTGASVFSAELEAKRLELFVELVPKATLIGILVDPNFSDTHAQAAQTETVGRALGREIRVVRASSESEIEAAFSELVEAKAGAMAVAANPFLNSRRSQVVTLAERDSGDLRISTSTGDRWPHQLWPERARCLPPGRRLRWTDSQRREAGRFAGRATGKVRTPDQSEGRQSTGPRSAGNAPRPRRRGDRIKRGQCLGTNRKCAGCQLDVPNQISEQAYDFEIP
jgi:hypothetical protein